MKNLILFISLFSSSICFAQKDTIFFDADWKKCTKAEASLYRVAYIQGDGFLLKDMYLKNNHPQMIAECKTLNPLIKNGKCSYYFESGKKNSEGNYINEKKEGIWINWDEDGKDSSVTQCNADGTYKYIRIAEKQKVNEIYNKNYPMEKMPAYVGDMEALMKFIKENVKYPKSEELDGISGFCYITFVVEKDGSITEAKILKGILNGPLCNQEALRVVKLMPSWVPGTQNGRPVRVQFNLPIKFTLRNKQ